MSIALAFPRRSSKSFPERDPGWEKIPIPSRKIIKVGMERIRKWAPKACSSSVLILANFFMTPLNLAMLENTNISCNVYLQTQTEVFYFLLFYSCKPYLFLIQDLNFSKRIAAHLANTMWINDVKNSFIKKHNLISTHIYNTNDTVHLIQYDCIHSFTLMFL